MVGTGEHGKVFIVNNNDTETINRLKDKKAYVITYGLCNKATLTLSSIEQDRMVLCLQRSVTDLGGNKIEPQEFSVSPSKEYDPEIIMLIAAICMISGVPADKLSKFVF